MANVEGEMIASPDFKAIRKYSELVFGGLQGLVPVRILPDGSRKGRPITPFVPNDAALPQTLLRYAEEAREGACGLYVVPGTVSAPRARACDIRQFATVVIDLDDGDIKAKKEHLSLHLGEPGMVVASGGVTPSGQAKLHLYWMLTEVLNATRIAQLCALRAEIAAKVGGYSHFASPHQPIRVAGSVHYKSAPRAVPILGVSDRRVSLNDLVAASAAMPPLESTQAKPIRTRPKVSTLMSSRIHSGAAEDMSRFGALSSVIGHWLRQAGEGHLTLEDAWVRVSGYNLACIDPPWAEDRLRREFDALRTLDQEKRASISAPPPLSEDDLASRFTAAHGLDWAYVASWGQWLHWTGTVWRTDAERQIRECIRLECRKVALTLTNAGAARRLGSSGTYAGVERIAQSDPRHATPVDVWDRNRETLNTPAGILDLRTGEVMPHDRDARMTRIAGAFPQGDCPRWRAFLTEISDGDEEIAKYLARVAGYSLTGLTSEHALFVLHGDGSNGKSTFVNVLRGILADYATSAPIETFVASNGERHPTELAGLAGVRLVTAIETEEGRSWAESKIKAVTGGDPVQARFVHKDFFEYTPQFKMMIVGNHKPRIRSFGEAMRRRIHLIPFAMTLPPERRDKDLVETLLRTERHGIMTWAVEGLVDWRRNGLVPPSAVRKATEAYFVDDDVLGEWLNERCLVDLNGFAGSSALFADWKRWADAAGEAAQSMRWLANELSRRGYKQCRTSTLRGFGGLRLREEASERGEAS